MGLDGANGVATPGLKPLAEQMLQDNPLAETQHTNFRALGLTANYLSADRPDIQYCAKEISRWMSAPMDLSPNALRRLCRYLIGR